MDEAEKKRRRSRRSRRRTRMGAPRQRIVGQSPGTLTADPDATPTKIWVICYGPDSLDEHELQSVDELAAILGRQPVTWVNVDGFADMAVLAKIGEIFALHPLVLEDVVNTHQRAKLEEYHDELFLIAHIVHVAADEAQAEEGRGGGSDQIGFTEQVSLFLGSNYVLTFQERAGDCFDPVRERLRAGRSQIRGSGPDYLAYALLDALTDSAFPLLERIDDHLADLEDELMESPDKSTARAVQAIKREILGLLRIYWPHRETMDKLYRHESKLLTDATRPYVRDCYDHSVQILDLLQNYREVSSGLMDLYHSSLGTRLNDIMRFLTVFATIFIPLTFIAGIYGMNFNTARSPWNMPELNWAFGYPIALGMMVVVAVGMLLYFKHRGWIGDD